MNPLRLLLFFCLAFSGCQAQDHEPAQTKPKTEVQTKPKTKVSFINNQALKHTIVLMACRTCAPMRSVGYRVVVTLTEAEQSRLSEISPATWLGLLNSNDTDFAANLLLYSIYDKDALLLSENNSPEIWRQYQKKDDLVFWTEALKKPAPMSPATP